MKYAGKFIILLLLIWQFNTLMAQKVGYAFSGGGARGFAQIGILKVLEAEGIYPDYISGTSIGAVVGALYAMGYSAAEIEELATEINWQETFRDSFERRDLNIGNKRWAPYGNLSFEIGDNWQFYLPQSMIAANAINLELFRLFAPVSAIRDFSALPIPFSCISTNLLTGNMHVFREGSLMQAVKSSMSIPSIIQPFEISDSLYIDGGISRNLPVEEVLEDGADFIFAFKTNSGLRPRQRINNLFQVFDQTVNISITKNVKASVNDCDFLFEPDLDIFNASDFRNLTQIIAAGEEYALSRIDEIRAIRREIGGKANHRVKPEPLYTLKIEAIEIEGNVHISSTKIREYLGLKPGRTYTLNSIVRSCTAVWNLQLFHFIYPELVPVDDAYKLIIHLKERGRKSLSINNSYTTEDALVAGAVLSLNNYISRNSSFLAEIKLGGKNELNIDFVRNFGETWGVYYRLFPYINEKTLYVYDDHLKVNSIGSLETGLTTGIGFFVANKAVLESYAYHYNTKLYRKIAGTDDMNNKLSVSGLGLKLLHENQDDFFFPMNGSRVVSKLSFSRNLEVEDVTYGKFVTELENLEPITRSLSLSLKFDYGANFNKEDNLSFDPFYLGGSEAYPGYQKYELSAPFYKIYSAALRYNPVNNHFLDFGVHGINYANRDIWSPEQNIKLCVYAAYGYSSIAGPLKLLVSLSDDKRINTYLNLGYSTDIFAFSRR